MSGEVFKLDEVGYVPAGKVRLVLVCWLRLGWVWLLGDVWLAQEH